jgi:hypothetical protein
MARKTHGAKTKTSRAILSGLVLLALAAATGCGMLGGKEEKRTVGQACTQNADCDSDACTTYGNVCTKNCTLDAECGEGLVCRVKDAGGGSQCAKPIGARTGSTCAKSAECDHGLCLKPQGASATDGGYCSQTCAASTDCPNGFTTCSANPNDASAKACQSATDDRIKIGDAQPTTPAQPGILTPRAVTTTPDAGTTPPPDAGTTTPDAGTRTRPKIELKPRQ